MSQQRHAVYRVTFKHHIYAENPLDREDHIKMFGLDVKIHILLGLDSQWNVPEPSLTWHLKHFRLETCSLTLLDKVLWFNSRTSLFSREVKAQFVMLLRHKCWNTDYLFLYFKSCFWIVSLQFVSKKSSFWCFTTWDLTLKHRHQRILDLGMKQWYVNLSFIFAMWFIDTSVSVLVKYK